jgi:phosphoribosyl 1,2-cyclic phosphate phosphodiesterase
MKVTLLGTGTSTGVPMIGCECRTCRSEDWRDKRLRVSALIEQGSTTILIDTSADFRQQMLTYDVKHLDAIFYTHSHYDHIAGFDDLRAFQFLHRKAPPCYANEETAEYIKQTFPYAFGRATQAGGGLPTITFTIIDSAPVHVQDLTVEPLEVMHGVLKILGFRIGGFAYLTDCSAVPDSTIEQLQGLEVLVLDGLRYLAHPTHFSIEESLDVAARINANMTYLTHMNHDIMHAEAEERFPPNIRLGYDGLTFDVRSTR